MGVLESMNRYRILTRRLNELTKTGQLIVHNMVVTELFTPSSSFNLLHILECGGEVNVMEVSISPFVGEMAGVLYFSNPLFLDRRAKILRQLSVVPER